MPPPSKKRKTAAISLGTSRVVSQQRGVQAFGKVSKAHINQSHERKSKAVEIQCQTDVKPTASKAGEKRKRDSSSPSLLEEVSGDLSKHAIVEQQVDPIPRKLHRSPASPNLPVKKGQLNAKTQSNTTATPTKGARAVLETFSLSSSPPSIRSTSPTLSLADTPPTSPSCARSPIPSPQESQHLPEALQDLIDLHASFLSSLSLHLAHHGSLTPVDLSILCPNIARAWRKEAVSVTYVRRILAIAQQGTASQGDIFSLSDYGNRKVCIEFVDIPSYEGLNKKVINEELLGGIFRQNLELQWSSYTNSSSSSPCVEAFIATLSLHPIKACSSLSKLSPLLAKGQRRLEDLKAGAIKAQKSSASSKLSSADSSMSTHSRPTTSRSDSLLSRIRAKETIQAALPPPPTAAKLERKSSLRRLEEVVPVIELLTSGTINRLQQHGRPLGNPQLQSQTQSFTMPTVIQHLQMSLRNPIAKDEAISCVRLLAELVPEWVAVRELGKCISVTVRRGNAVDRSELDKRVRDMMDRI